MNIAQFRPIIKRQDQKRNNCEIDISMISQMKISSTIHKIHTAQL